ncbi:protein FLOWERING LOCUS T-like [Andrographis paniculata]|uniref:protein FLOWERING LOCUS T-like n=1 Tax=Andrographis paniculata TaxID=175694 RepID=UPI0021E6DCF5|nr:protein FLOWERING LOCUS T-like [Andrographis paniculata]XP_051125931.1 protein FLOWERING LOCUS T-like [Andrographis paniculata]XP_051125932.1 protein FLOWERING LOCUS T-like [Andrographis paniculata]XP_051125933.1 protein FLOWERING LOCUS T-like [Andrographis paniculata]XP_051125934.1 protein FLOWERING LOCUS T-like [Andrographis paniculata]XP_051125935.1 protein FLOWERING LOCUS T-like [Andrographis paniculata]XP_051125936.1 protein FLOWERING LOCUS T-like [Andrographis paniculata]XP_05112593
MARERETERENDECRPPIPAALVMSRVVGDVLGPFTPTADLRLLTSDGSIVFNGTSLRPSNVAAPPRLHIAPHHHFQGFYTLVMVDADAPNPSNPHFKEYLHWLVTDIPAAESSSGSGNEMVRYESPKPTMGIHRIVLVVFQQSRGRGRAVTAPQWRRNFTTREFSEANCLGSPIAALYYNCQRQNGTGGRRPPTLR